MSGFSLKRFSRDQSGSVSIIAALSLVMLLTIAAIVIDNGSLYYARRDLQAATDAAALAAVQNPSSATSIAADSLTRNGYTSPLLTVTTGVYTPDEALSASSRFTSATSGVNAVRVQAVTQKSLYFGRFLGFGPTRNVSAHSTAARLPSSSFGAGTAVGRLNAGLTNALLSQLWGSSVSLSLIDYQSLLNTDVDALTFFDHLATAITVSGTYQQLADASVTTGQILTALIETASTSGAVSGNQSGALIALKSLQLQLGSLPPVVLSNVVNLSPILKRRIGNITSLENRGLSLNIMSLVSANARTVAAGRLINLGTAITVPITNSSVSTRIAIGNQMAQVSDAQIGDSIHTAQIRIAVSSTLANVNLGVATATIQIPIFVEMASGEARLTAMPCGSGGVMAQVAASSGVAKASFGTVSNAALNNFSTAVTPVAAPVLNISLLGIPIQAGIAGGATIASTGPSTLSFTQADINSGTVKSVPGTGTSPFTALASNFTLSTSILGNPGALASLLNTQLSSLLAALNPIVSNLIGQLVSPVDGLAAALGLQLGTIDVRVFDSSCRIPTLVG